MTRSTTPDRRYATVNPDRLSRLEGVKLAGFRVRLGAFLVDAALIFALGALIALLLSGGKLPRAASDGSPALQVGGVISFLTFVGYFALATWLGQGRTPGKRLFRIRVLPLHHERLSLWHCTERALGYGASSLEAGLGFLQFFTHPNRQTVHDRIAETIVIKDGVT